MKYKTVLPTSNFGCRHLDRTYRRLLWDDDAYSRQDESDDSLFYRQPRIVQHLDRTALETMRGLIGSLIVEGEPAILDLMASIDSHLPVGLQPCELVGLGLNREELQSNRALTDCLIHDLNRDPQLPFGSARFDCVLNTVSIQYLTKPREIFNEVGRILKPGGLFLVVFSNRSFPTKAVKVWELLADDERLSLVTDYFIDSKLFDVPRTYVSMGRPRPRDDKYADSGHPSDPVFTVFADRLGGDPGRPARAIPDSDTRLPDPELVAARSRSTRDTLRCPYCDERLKLWLITENPWTTWNHDLHICINDACPYLVQGWKVMFEQGNHNTSYRYVYDAVKDASLTIPVPSLAAIKDSLAD